MPIKDDPNDDNFSQIPRDMLERRRLKGVVKEEREKPRGVEVENFSAPIAGFGVKKEDDSGGMDPNYRQMLRDLEERRRLAGALTREAEKEKSFEVENFNAPSILVGKDDKVNLGANGANFTHLPYDLAERRRLAPKIEDAPPSSDVDLTKGRFETMPSRAISDEAARRAGGSARHAGEMSSSKARAGANYAKAYLEQQQRDKELADKKRAEQAKEAAKKQTGTKANDERRFRAKQLMEDIAWWNGQYGQGAYDDATIGAKLFELQHELDGIPDVFKN